MMMMSDIDSPTVALEALARIGLENKTREIAAYDSILWKIRTGFLVVLFAGVGMAGLVAGPGMSGTKVVVALMLILGFAAMIGTIDLQYLRAKLRVVSSQDKLFEWLVSGRPLDADRDALTQMLKNAGERPTPVTWSRYHSRTPFLFLYMGAPAVACMALIVLYAA